MSIIKKYFQNEENLTKKEITYAKAAFVIDGSCNATASNFVGGAYLATFFAYLGASESQSNFIISLPAFTMLFGLLAPLLTKRAKFYKPFTYICKFFVQFPAGLIFLLPVITGINFFSVVLGAVLYFICSAASNLLTPTYNVWYMNAISADGKNPGFYLGTKSMITFAMMIASILFAAKLFKIFSDERQLYFFIIVGVLVLALATVISLVIFPIKEAPMAKKEQTTSSVKDYLDMFRDKVFAPFLAGNTIFLTSVSLVSAMINVFMVQRLGIGLDIISYMTIFDFALRSAFSPICGKLMTKLGAKKVLAISYLFIGISHGLFAFMNVDNFIVLKLISSLFMGIGYAGHGVSSFKYIFEVMPPEKSTSYIAGSSALAGITGYLASMVTTFVIATANGAAVSIFGCEFSEMSFLFIISTVMACISIFYLYSRKGRSL